MEKTKWSCLCKDAKESSKDWNIEKTIRFEKALTLKTEWMKTIERVHWAKATECTPDVFCLTSASKNALNITDYINEKTCLQWSRYSASSSIGNRRLLRFALTPLGSRIFRGILYLEICFLFGIIKVAFALLASVVWMHNCESLNTIFACLSLSRETIKKIQMAKLRAVHTRGLSWIAEKRGISQSDSKIFTIPDQWDAREKKKITYWVWSGRTERYLGRTTWPMVKTFSRSGKLNSVIRQFIIWLLSAENFTNLFQTE